MTVMVWRPGVSQAATWVLTGTGISFEQEKRLPCLEMAEADIMLVPEKKAAAPDTERTKSQLDSIQRPEEAQSFRKRTGDMPSSPVCSSLIRVPAATPISSRGSRMAPRMVWEKKAGVRRRIFHSLLTRAR